MGLKKYKKMQIKRKNLFCYTHEKKTTFRVIGKTLDMGDNPYILKFVDSNKDVFFLMYTDFKTQLETGKIIFAEEIT